MCDTVKLKTYPIIPNAIISLIWSFVDFFLIYTEINIIHWKFKLTFETTFVYAPYSKGAIILSASYHGLILHAIFTSITHSNFQIKLNKINDYDVTLRSEGIFNVDFISNLKSCSAFKEILKCRKICNAIALNIYKYINLEDLQVKNPLFGL